MWNSRSFFFLSVSSIFGCVSMFSKNWPAEPTRNSNSRSCKAWAADVFLIWYCLWAPHGSPWARQQRIAESECQHVYEVVSWLVNSCAKGNQQWTSIEQAIGKWFRVSKWFVNGLQRIGKVNSKLSISRLSTGTVPSKGRRWGDSIVQ